MWKLLIFVKFYTCIGYDYSYFDPIAYLSRMDTNQELDLTHTHFDALRNYHYKAVPVRESEYPWVARVVHSRVSTIPHVCTASCIASRIFITAARCLHSLKVSYTRLHYNSYRLPVLAFVIPSKPSKQSFDDIGLVVVEPATITWRVIQLFNVGNRTDKHFNWFADIEKEYGHIDFKVVGYAKQKGAPAAANNQFDLTELKVYSDMNTCSNIMTRYGRLKNAFRVPCYHACNSAELEEHANGKRNDKCNYYHGVEGGAVIDNLSKKLIGVATWGASYSVYELPVGYAVANSDNFYEDYNCAVRIRDREKIITSGHYQSVCELNV